MGVYIKSLEPSKRKAHPRGPRGGPRGPAQLGSAPVQLRLSSSSSGSTDADGIDVSGTLSLKLRGHHLVIREEVWLPHDSPNHLVIQVDLVY